MAMDMTTLMNVRQLATSAMRMRRAYKKMGTMTSSPRQMASVWLSQRIEYAVQDAYDSAPWKAAKAVKKEPPKKKTKISFVGGCGRGAHEEAVVPDFTVVELSIRTTPPALAGEGGYYIRPLAWSTARAKIFYAGKFPDVTGATMFDGGGTIGRVTSTAFNIYDSSVELTIETPFPNALKEAL